MYDYKYRVGERVIITAGENKGKSGIITEREESQGYIKYIIMIHGNTPGHVKSITCYGSDDFEYDVKIKDD